MMKLSDEIIARCREYGDEIVRSYGRGNHPESAALSILGAEKNATLQAEAKMAECIFAAERRIPLSDINWTGRPELNGVDVVINGIAVDVKYCWPEYRLLIWSAGKGLARLKSKEFDVFVLVKCRLATGGGESTHWITRREFIAKHKVARPPSSLMSGTLYMHQSELRSIAVFPSGRDCLPENMKLDSVASSTWDAYTWLRKYHPERLKVWLDSHPELR